ncbi:hypothetical protein [uncultured Thiothrix sp.]|uniref:hypothetical protein n=1 Tax=uncultured Thiothrix sp. TaxID=223185 RepID=UPI00262E95F6|nr:hypothetical protein [uncultured Thiothrix sp.]
MLSKSSMTFILFASLVGTVSAAPSMYSANSIVKVKPEKMMSILSTCDLGNSTTCVGKSLKKWGASPAALQFSKDIKNEGFLVSFQEKGVVDLGEAFMPFRANTNDAYVMLNGQPKVVSTEIQNIKGLEKDPQYKTLKKKYKNLEFWGTRAEFVKVNKTKAGQSFIFNYTLKDGCNACGTPWASQVAFRFNPQGKFLGSQFVKIVKP